MKQSFQQGETFFLVNTLANSEINIKKIDNDGYDEPAMKYAVGDWAMMDADEYAEIEWFDHTWVVFKELGSSKTHAIRMDKFAALNYAYNLNEMFQ